MGSQGIGVEFHAQGVRVARVRASAKGIQVQHAAEASFPQGTVLTSLEADAVPKEVAAMLDPRYFSGWETTAVVDHPSVFFSVFRLAAGFTDELKTGIRWYAEQYVPYPVDQAAVDFQVQDSPYGGQKSVSLVVLQKAVVGKVMELMPPKRVKLRRIDGVPYAVHRLYQVLVAGEGELVEPAVVVHAPGSKGYVFVTNRGRLEPVRHVRLGRGILVSLPAKVRQTCQYYEAHHPTESIRAVYATLPTLAIDGVREALAAELGLEVRALDLAAHATFAGSKEAPEPGEGWAEKYTLAVGAAL